MSQIPEELALVRDDALEVASSLEEIAAALRVIALGGADSSDVDLLRGSIDGRGLLLVEAALDWDLLCRHASSEVTLDSIEGAT